MPVRRFICIKDYFFGFFLNFDSKYLIIKKHLFGNNIDYYQSATKTLFLTVKLDKN